MFEVKNNDTTTISYSSVSIVDFEQVLEHWVAVCIQTLGKYLSKFNGKDRATSMDVAVFIADFE